MDARTPGEPNRSILSVSNCGNFSNNVGAYEVSLWLQSWLSTLETNKRHRDVSNRRLNSVGDWALRRAEFESWSKGQDGSVDPTLLCYGGPGVGKTYLSSLVIDTLRDRTGGQNIAVLCVYCDYQAQKDQSAVSMMGDLLRQVDWKAAGIQPEIQSAFKELKRRGSQGLQLSDMLQLLVKVISSIDRVYICVDAVDELLPQSQLEFLGALRQILQDAPNTRLFLTARPHARVELDKYLTKGAFIIHIIVDQGDITRYLNRRMDRDHIPNSMTDNLKNTIVKSMLGEASEMFLLVALNINAILGEASLARRKEMLQKVAATGADLESVYAQTLQRIREQKGDRSRLGIEALMWVSHSERPLRIHELCHALAVQTGLGDLDPKNIPLPDRVLGSCLGLVVIDDQTSTLRLIHYTLQEYLSSPGILPHAHETLAETCLAYLNHKQVKGLRADHYPNFRGMPFLEYSSFYWGNHAKMGPSDHTKSLALELLLRYDNHISATLLFNKMQNCGFFPVVRRQFAGLHCASCFGIVEVMAALIEMEGCDVNRGDCEGFTPLIWAARRGNEAAVRLLLTLDDVNADKADKYGQTPLWWASYKGHKGVVELLLARNDVSPDKSNRSGQTPLSTASENGHGAVVRLLLTREEVNPDKPDNEGRTPLWRAILNGSESTTSLLLNPDKPNDDERTTLSTASENGYEAVVRLLLSRGDVNPDKPDNCGRTLLWWASASGRTEVVRGLLTRDGVNPDAPDNIGRTPLLIASMEGHWEIVALLQLRETEMLSAD